MRGIFNVFSRLFLAARLRDESLRRRELVLNTLLVTTLGVLILSAIALAVSYSMGNAVLTRLGAVVIAIAIAATLYILSRVGHYFVAACGLLVLYGLLSTVMAIKWGVNLPMSILAFSLVIVLSGILLGARYSLYITVLIGCIIFGVQLGVIHGTLHPDFRWQQAAPSFSDIIGYFFIFTMLGMSSWLFNGQTDAALHQALRAEAAVTRQKKLLETKVEERTRELQAAQMEKIQQLYRFAQLGQFSTSLLHDLANHLTTLSLDIEGIEEKHRSNLLQRARKRIRYIDNMVQWAYDHLNGKVQPKTFDAAREIDEVLNILQHQAQRAQVQLKRIPNEDSRSAFSLHGDPNRFRQIIANLVANAIDAYQGMPKHIKREVTINTYSNADSLLVLVHDKGKGVPADMQQTIFEPFYSTKHTGMGIGLYIVKQIVEEHFGGSINLTSEDGTTTFSVKFRREA